MIVSKSGRTIAYAYMDGGIVMKIMLDAGAYMPERAHKTDAGLDIRAMTAKVIPARGHAVFHTGVHVQLPPNTKGELKSKSGLHVKHGIITEGLIDEGYTGEIVVRADNLSDEDYLVEKGDKISQLVVSPVDYVGVELADSLDDSDRGSDGFGSTGR